jgi:hypothetical protein
MRGKTEGLLSYEWGVGFWIKSGWRGLYFHSEKVYEWSSGWTLRQDDS